MAAISAAWAAAAPGTANMAAANRVLVSFLIGHKPLSDMGNCSIWRAGRYGLSSRLSSGDVIALLEAAHRELTMQVFTPI
jgi:hypothetical protein